MTLTNTTTGQLADAGSKRYLAAGFLNRIPQLVDNGHRDFVHKRDHTTVSDIAVNTRCHIAAGQTPGMAKPAETSAFWERLTLARESCRPPKSMRQEDVARDTHVRQSAVTKWKTGLSVPRPRIVRELAEACDVSFAWLYEGRGEMRIRGARDPLTLQVMEVIDSLTPEGKIEILKAVITQQTLETPEVAARVKAAQKIADAFKRQRRTG